MKSNRIIFALFMISLVFIIPGCAKDDEIQPDPDREAYLGIWNVTPTKLTYEVTITADDASSNGVFIKNFALIGNNFPPAKATISGSTITLEADQVIGTGLKVNGSGVLSGNKITWNYTTFDGADLTNVFEIYTRK